MRLLGNQVFLRERADCMVMRNRQDTGVDHHCAKLTGMIGSQVCNQPVRILVGLKGCGRGSHVLSLGTFF
jgi:hypothetical protein